MSLNKLKMTSCILLASLAFSTAVPVNANELKSNLNGLPVKEISLTDIKHL